MLEIVSPFNRKILRFCFAFGYFDKNLRYVLRAYSGNLRTMQQALEKLKFKNK